MSKITEKQKQVRLSRWNMIVREEVNLMWYGDVITENK